LTIHLDRKPTNHEQICLYCSDLILRGEIRATVDSRESRRREHFHAICLISDLILRAKNLDNFSITELFARVYRQEEQEEALRTEILRDVR